MTQRRWTSEGYTILTGWDLSRQQFLLVIDDIEPQGPTAIYSNLLNDQAPYQPDLTLDDIEELLWQHAIGLPTTLIDDLADDQRLNRGDVTMNYDGDTSIG